MSFLTGTYVVTGASGGIGRATVETLAEAGLTLLMADIDVGVEAHAQELRAAGGSVQSRVLNVSDEASVEALVHSLNGTAVRGLVNIAGIMQSGPIEDITADDWDTVVDVNLKGTFLMCRALVPLMKAAGGGSVVNISSVGGQSKSYVAAVNYGASKAGVIGLTMLLATQEASSNIRVNCVAPGHVATPMYWGVPEPDRLRMASNVPMARAADPREVADPIAYLLSEQASYITGHTLNVNGGLYM